MLYDEIDWGSVWIEQMKLHNEADEQVQQPDRWGTYANAKRFWQSSRKSGKRLEKALKDIKHDSDSRILDIGAGPGSMAILLAQRVSHVTAVEPADGMTEVLRENIADNNLSNVTCIQKNWEDVSLEELDSPYDVVVASYSLHVPDIREAIEKIQQVSSGKVYIYWFAGATSWDKNYSRIWPQLHGRQYYPSPKCDVLYNVLYSMGIYPDMENFELTHDTRFSSLDEAVEHYKPHYKIATNEQEQILRSHLEQILEKEADELVQVGRSSRVKISWDNSH
ncbi:class I SAM-dependent methyltransferase [Methanohalophilus portucalensis]|uniref:Class I SAM-dependent methyltransferase n=2 Tax=Methanohalophilus portucalensis TaxID=39664 RepID=A0A1L9C537_9EURY|nr:class I SAM-dependent methyltransferase [Methanohalophilus portucalensis]ATU08285.1 SAM-dependent methyltransferase [Methanohalophilus portucalensis]OJH49603.1 methyltransferase type 11 [Methanohalophilus portucalensis FDF-1]RNI13549.1 class I SAM-dependent methyltransferase [Methanohalophilus portucalensis FDF-1]SMH35194.1 methyltransferase, FkbM family [Methanohalophilus portucalensis FDF-1]